MWVIIDNSEGLPHQVHSQLRHIYYKVVNPVITEGNSGFDEAILPCVFQGVNRGAGAMVLVDEVVPLAGVVAGGFQHNRSF